MSFDQRRREDGHEASFERAISKSTSRTWPIRLRYGEFSLRKRLI